MPDWRFDFTEVLPLNSNNLYAIEDRRSLPDVRYKEMWEVNRPDRAFYAAYIEALRARIAAQKP